MTALTIDFADLRRAKSEACASHGDDHLANAVYITVDGAEDRHVAFVPFDTKWAICSDLDDANALAEIIATAIREWAVNR